MHLLVYMHVYFNNHLSFGDFLFARRAPCCATASLSQAHVRMVRMMTGTDRLNQMTVCFEASKESPI